MSENDSRGNDGAAALARELVDRIAAIATPPPARPSAPAASVPGAPPSARVSLAHPLAILEQGTRFVAPVLPEGARLRAAKGLVLRALRIVTRDQTTFNTAVAETMRTALAEIESALNAALGTGAAAHALAAASKEEALRRADAADARADSEERARERLERTLRDVEARIGTVADELRDALTREAHARETLERDRDARAEALARRQERDEETHARLASRLAGIAEELRQMRLVRGQGEPARPAAAQAPAPKPAGAQPLDPGDLSRAAVYFDFERRFRGSEEEIKERQRADAERFRGAPGPVVDLGCGRGEFVELLREAGVEALGIEANPLMVARGREKGLPIEHGDLFELLSAREDGSLGGITAFQVVEHLPPALLFTLAELAYAKLAPGGRLLLETINPESIYAMRWFWMDLTHVRPVPAPSLEQLLLMNGFRDVEIDWRSPVPASESLDAASDPRLAPVARLLFGPQDYAVTGVR